MTPNVGTTDRIIREILGVANIASGVYYQSWWGAMEIAPIFLASIGWCPAYVSFGISSCKK